VLLSAAGMALLVATGTPVLVVTGAACFGTGFGLLQNATLTLMYARVSADGYNSVSAIWNAAYDAGMGGGAVAIGLLVAHIGYPAAFGLTSALIIPALLLTRRERTTR
jgi:predicted MFS family arabinose efflux permease